MCKFFDSYEIFEKLVAVVTEMSHVGYWDIKEPDHDVVSFLVDQEADVDPVAHHQDCEKYDCSSEDVFGC